MDANMEVTMADSEKRNTIRDWFTGHGDWATAMAVMISCFAFVFHETVSMNHRLDDHITAIYEHTNQINKRIDETTATANKQWFEMQKQFYDLLREMKNDRQHYQQSTISTNQPKVPRGFETPVNRNDPGLDRIGPMP